MTNNLRNSMLTEAQNIDLNSQTSDISDAAVIVTSQTDNVRTDEPNDREGPRLLIASAAPAAAIPAQELEVLPTSENVVESLEDIVSATEDKAEPQADQSDINRKKDPLLVGINSRVDIVIRLMSGVASFFHTSNGDAFAEIRRGDHSEVWSIKSEAFSLLLQELYYRKTNSVLKQSDLKMAIFQAEAMARFDGQMKEVGLRVTKQGDAIYIDLCNHEWQQIEITANGWKVIEMEKSPAKFRRTNGMRALPRPEPGGDLNRVRNLLNLEKESNFILLVSFLIGAMNPSGPFPILIIQGVEGSAKTTTSIFTRSLLDPSIVPARTLPSSERDLAISAEASRLLCFDNVSKINDYLSDAFCRIATGGGFGTRKLYTGKSEELFHSTRPVIFNGIPDFIGQHDFADRALVVKLPPIQAGNRRPMTEIKRDWESVKPIALGALCDAVVEALKNYENVQLDRSPRMADFAKWVVAAEPALPWENGRFMAEYEKNRLELVEVAVESDPLSLSVMEMIKHIEGYEWNGTPTQLLKELASYAPNNVARKKDWPQAPNILTNRLRRVQTSLRAIGVEVETGKSGGSRYVAIRMMKQAA